MVWDPGVKKSSDPGSGSAIGYWKNLRSLMPNAQFFLVTVSNSYGAFDEQNSEVA
jgi:hypothetical protein